MLASSGNSVHHWLVGMRDGTARLEASLVFSYEVTGMTQRSLEEQDMCVCPHESLEAGEKAFRKRPGRKALSIQTWASFSAKNKEPPSHEKDTEETSTPMTECRPVRKDHRPRDWWHDGLGRDGVVEAGG